MRSDSIYLFTRTLSLDAAEAAAAAEAARADSLAALARANAAADSLRAARESSARLRATEAPDSLARHADGRRSRAARQVEEQLGKSAPDSLGGVSPAPAEAPRGVDSVVADSLGAAVKGLDSLATDSLATDSLAADTAQLTPAQLKAQRKEEARNCLLYTSDAADEL